ncbi:hypothetical protein [Massilia sp. CCM 8734]|uniref:hypothetical protein n=1 Tax=Massilia sp. CCM 8734 TaxID=2609283 RepID=UPI00141EC753|nr:hypothetical protein [Massilia sp. CCM 8734]NHZ94307.1 hypothetical protein [Massilia sp. CCM 8734]
MKFAFLMNRAVFGFCTQGLDRSPAELSGLGANTNVSATLREEVKRCLVELSLKEIVAGVKPFPVSHPVPSETVHRLTLLGTRSLNSGRNSRKTLIASIEVDIDSAGVRVRSTRRTPWSEERLANLGFVEQFPFLVDQDQEVRDRQFWMIDATSGKRLRTWHGSFVPKLLLNQRYAGIEAALAYQENERNGLRDVEFYSKSKFYNLLPYYISMRDQGTKARTESLGQLIPLQDRGRWVRVFIPPADGIDGTGTSLSGMRDVMVYTNNGEVIADGLLDEPLLHFYLHTMTNGILVSGGNSKMSLLEKFVRLTLEN